MSEVIRLHVLWASKARKPSPFCKKMSNDILSINNFVPIQIPSSMMRQFFQHPKHNYDKTEGKEHNYNFRPKCFVYLNL